MSRSKSSGRWLAEHESDPFVKQSRVEGYRSRAVYKLKEINDKDRLLRPGMTAVDLGAAPGGWSQLAAEILQRKGGSGQVFALDRLAMEPLPGVTFIQGDFTQDEPLTQLQLAMAARKADLVLSDMAPNISGVAVADQASAMYLAELALDFSREHLNDGGDFLVKVFQGAGFDEYLKTMRSCFQKVLTRKPAASRNRSREVYLLARSYTGQ